MQSKKQKVKQQNKTIMQQFGNKYSDAKLSQMKMWLQDMADKGIPKYYEVYVDDTITVARTKKLDEFDDHKYYIDQDSRVVKVFVYNTDQTHRYKQYIYEIKDISQLNKPVEKGLSGLETDQKIAIEKERWDTQRLREKLEESENRLKEAEEHIDKVTLLNNKLKEEAEQSSGKKILVKLAEKAIDNPLMMLKVGQLAGIIPKAGENKSLDGTESESEKEGDVTFKRKNNSENTNSEQEEQEEEQEEEPEIGTITEGQYKVLEALHKADKKLKEQDIDQLGRLMNQLTEDPSLILIVSDLIKNETETK